MSVLSSDQTQQPQLKKNCSQLLKYYLQLKVQPGLRSRFRRVRFLGTLETVSDKNSTPTPDVQLNHFLHRTTKLGIPVETMQFLFKLLLKQIIFTVCHDFHWFLVAIKLLTPNFIQVLLRSWKFWKGRTFYLDSATLGVTGEISITIEFKCGAIAELNSSPQEACTLPWSVPHSDVVGHSEIRFPGARSRERMTE